MKVSDRQKLIGRMRNSGLSITIAEGGAWVAEQRQASVNAAAGIYGDAFSVSLHSDPAQIHWISRFENLLSQSNTEQSAYDFKQGFIRLDGSNSFDENCFNKVMETLVGIANIRKGYTGYVLVGVAETIATAQRVQELFSVEPIVYSGFYVTGLDHEAVVVSKNQDKYFQNIIDKTLQSGISSPLKEYIARHLKMIKYYDKTVFVFEVIGQDDPSNIDGRYYDRTGAQLKEVEPANLAGFIRRYIAGQ